MSKRNNRYCDWGNTGVPSFKAHCRIKRQSSLQVSINCHIIIAHVNSGTIVNSPVVTTVRPDYIEIRNVFYTISVNSSPPSAAYVRQWIESALVHIMACRLSGAKKLSSKAMLGYCQFDPWEQNSVKYQSKYKNFHSRKCFGKYRLRPFCPGEMS